MVTNRQILLASIQARFDYLNDTVLDSVYFDTLNKGMSSVQSQQDRETFVYNLREELNSKIEEMVRLTELKTKLENKIPVEL